MKLHRLEEWPAEDELDGMEKEAMMLGERAEAVLDKVRLTGKGGAGEVYDAMLSFQVACAVTQLVGLVRDAQLSGTGKPTPKKR